MNNQLNEIVGANLQPDLDFSLFACRFRFRAIETLQLPPGKAGNIVRGALGTIFRSLVCHPDCISAKTCPLRGQCPYARLFEPTAIIPGPSGLGDWPRPFVLRAAHLDGRTVNPGESFHFDVHLFDLHEAALQYFILTFAQLGKEGLGPGRGRAFLTAVHGLDRSGRKTSLIYDGEGESLIQTPSPIVLQFHPPSIAVSRIRVEFQTPTEIKEDQRILAEPVFGSLFKRLLSRLSDLRMLYGNGPLNLDFAGMGIRADRVKMISNELTHIEVERRAGHSNQSHSIGGFVGKAEYEGNLSEFIPFLAAGYWTGVGRQTTWGKGVIRILGSS
jgi:hypothetical protein